MSLQDPNEQEALIEAYATAALRETQAREALQAADKEMKAATLDKQERWRQVDVQINSGQILPGIYRLQRRNQSHAEGVLIDKYHDYPPIFPMWRN